jgi:tetratricopeptide (TPR) repeat protein
VTAQDAQEPNPVEEFAACLRALREEARDPALERLVELTRGTKWPLARSTLHDKLLGKSVIAWDVVRAFVTACQAHAESEGIALGKDAVDVSRWDSKHAQMLDRVAEGRVQARHAKAAREEISRRAARPAALDVSSDGAAGSRPSASLGIAEAGSTVGLISPLQLGVHTAPLVTSGDEDASGQPEPLPRYLPRRHDEELRERIRQAAGPAGPDHSIFAVLTGDSAVGKTRTLHEALIAVVPSWPLLTPQDSGELLGLLQSDRVQPGTVLWLDETQRHLDGATGARAASLLERILYATPRVVVVGALWDKPYWSELTAQGLIPDTNAAARRLLTGSRTYRIRVPDHLDEDERRAFRDLAARPGKHFDQRVEHALTAGAGDGRVIQRLTAGPELLDALLHGGLFSPVERAVLSASADARRLGHLTPIPPTVLTHGADGYLQPQQRPDSLAGCEAALDALSTGRRQDGSRTDTWRAVTALTAVRASTGARPGYEPDNYLVQHTQLARQAGRVPAALWDALVLGTSNPQDRIRLARSAFQRRLYRLAVALLEPAADAGGARDMDLLADLLEAAGHDDKASTWRQRADLLRDDGDRLIPFCSGTEDRFPHNIGKALLQIDIRQFPDDAKWRHWFGEWQRWASSDPPAASTSFDLPPEMLGQPQPKWHGDNSDVEWFAAWLAWSWGETACVGMTTRIMMRDTLLEIHEPEHPRLWFWMPPDRIYFRSLLKPLREYWVGCAASGDVDAMRILARLAVLEERYDEAVRLLQQAAEGAAAVPMAAVMRDRAHILACTGDRDEASQWLQRAADAGDLNASCQILDSAGRSDEARLLLRDALERGDRSAERKLTQWLERAGHSQESDQLRRFGIEPGGSTAEPW